MPLIAYPWLSVIALVVGIGFGAVIGYVWGKRHGFDDGFEEGRR